MPVALSVALLLAAPPDLSRAEAHDRRAAAAIAKSNLMAERRHRRAALREAEKVLKATDPLLLPYIERAARSEETAGDFHAAAALFGRALTLAVHLKKPPIERARLKDRVAMALWYTGDFRRAETLSNESLRIREQVHGKDSEQVARQLTLIAVLHQTRMEYPAAERLQRRALEIYEKAYPEHDTRLLQPLFQIASLQMMRQRFEESERTFARIFEILDKNPPPTLDTRAVFLEQLGRLFDQSGHAKRAAEVWGQAEKIRVDRLTATRKDPGTGGWQLASARTMLAMHYSQRQVWKKAIPLMREMVAHAREKTPMAVGPYRMQLAMALTRLGRDEEARGHMEAAVKAETAWLGKKRGTSSAMMLAELEYRTGRYRRANALFAQVARGHEAVFGAGYSARAFMLERQALIQWAMGKTKTAVRLMTDALDISENTIRVVLQAGTEQDRRTYLRRMSFQLDEAVSLHLNGAPNSAPATRLALRTIVQRKGRLLDASADSFSALHRRLSDDDQVLLGKLLSARGRLARLVIKGPPRGGADEYAREVAELEAAVRTLESRLALRSAQFKAQTLEIAVDGVRAAIPDDATLLELVSWVPIDPKKPGKLVGVELVRAPGPRRYAAYIVRATGKIRAIDLGEARPIDGAVSRLREALADPDRDDAKALGRVVDALVMQKIRPHLSDHVLIAPDGALNLVPFGALVDEHGRFAVQQYRFTYLTSGRDLLRLDLAAASRSKPTVVADPEFGDGAPATDAKTRGIRSLDLTTRWAALPGTRDEATALATLIPETRVLTGDRATESALKALRGPRVLHVATHGFFLEDEARSKKRRGGRPAENPLLRSGLALSGANQLQSGDEDGVLTAFEASGLDLWGTRLVVLSACETGLGTAENGEGVYGLRRALVIAGAETQVMSLWQVDDQATKDLMISFYRRLEKGLGRTDALRKAQLRMLQREETRHPYYWAAFIPSGQWAPMTERSTPP